MPKTETDADFAQIIIPPTEAYTDATYLNLFSLTIRWFYDFFAYHHGPAGYGFGKQFRVLLGNINYSLLGCDVACVLLLAILLTFIRKWVADRLEPVTAFATVSIGPKHFIYSQIMVKRKWLTEKTFIRFMESFYVCCFTSISFTWAYLLERNLGYLSRPEKVWQDFDIFATVPTVVWVLYVLEVGHYLHSVYAVLRINPWNNEDSVIMLTHHVFALTMLVLSYITKTHYLAVPMFLLHDLCDVILEACRCVIKLTPQSVWGRRLAEAIKVALFITLIVTWFWARLYLFPLRLIYPATIYLSSNSLDLWFPVDFILFVLLWLIQVMNVYWAYVRYPNKQKTF